jgi:hypothetical protein
MILFRERLEASPDLYQKLFERRMLESSEDYRPLSSQNISRNGIEGVRLVFLTRERGIRFRYITDIFTVEDDHIRLAAQAPEEVFENYSDIFLEMLDSVELLDLQPTAPLPPLPGEEDQP